MPPTGFPCPPPGSWRSSYPTRPRSSWIFKKVKSLLHFELKKFVWFVRYVITDFMSNYIRFWFSEIRICFRNKAAITGSRSKSALTTSNSGFSRRRSSNIGTVNGFFDFLKSFVYIFEFGALQRLSFVGTHAEVFLFSAQSEAILLRSRSLALSRFSENSVK